MGILALVAAVELITLHMLDGRAVMVNPEQITHLSETRSADNPKKQLTDEVNCVIRFTDATYTTVKMTCDEVRDIIQQGKNP